MRKNICWKCGKAIEEITKKKDRYFCEDCFEQHRKEHKELVEQYTALKDKVMYENALRLIEKSKTNINEYIKSAKKIEKAMQKNIGAFRSADEVVTAIILDYNEVLFEPNKRIGDYITDFYIPEFKICVEVDGHLHRHRTMEDCERDIEIKNILGKEWEIIRIDTKYIEKNPSEIFTGILSQKITIETIRENNNGIIPEYYSRRYRDYYNKIGEHKYKKYFK